MRYPFAPVEVHRGDTEISVIAERVGVTHATVQKWRQRGMDEKNADRVATALGLHPWQLWPEMLADATAPVMRECPTCGEFFVLTRKDKRYCRKACQRPSQAAKDRKRERARAKYHREAEWREAKLRRRREGYAANPHPERYKQKLRDAAKREAA
jgi:lambda repressor-like predicted transcriptional regulator